MTHAVQAPPIRLMFVDDHPIVRIGLAALIGTLPGMETVAQAGSGREAIALHREHAPDVTLMDLRLPDISGVETIRTIRAASPESRFIVVTTYEGDEDIHQALQAGASGYIIKGLPHNLLAEAIKRVHAGGRYLPSVVKRTLASRTPNSDLSAREREILARIAQGKSNREIAAELQLAEITVKVRVSAILERLGVNDRTEAVVAALQRGLLHL
ncbi:response regulator [Granulicella aggregans]|uniref:response regulator n=1 Tax=Granulicella aggregans TaxID=474949 RepID=UPI0021E005E5|nr:response regulator transcription factor [Granulicella aggregans]